MNTGGNALAYHRLVVQGARDDAAHYRERLASPRNVTRPEWLDARARDCDKIAAEHASYVAEIEAKDAEVSRLREEAHWVGEALALREADAAQLREADALVRRDVAFLTGSPKLLRDAVKLANAMSAYVAKYPAGKGEEA